MHSRSDRRPKNPKFLGGRPFALKNQDFSMLRTPLPERGGRGVFGDVDIRRQRSEASSFSASAGSSAMEWIVNSGCADGSSVVFGYFGD